MPINSPVTVLLDTHFWLWYCNGEEKRFSPRSLRTVRNAAHNSALLVSVISVWEIGMLEVKGRIRLDRPVEAWTREALAMPGTELVALTPEIALASSRLPGPLHNDPADRIIAAMARDRGARLLTRDENLLAYGRQQYVDLVES